MTETLVAKRFDGFIDMSDYGIADTLVLLGIE